jgi:cyclin-dependent kinase
VLLGATGYSYAVDVWSVGCTFAEMVSGKPLFEFTSDIEQLEAIFRILGTPDTREWSPDLRLHVDLEVPVWPTQALQTAVPALDVLGDNGIQLLTDMLQVNPSRRLSAMDALKSPFFDDIRDIYVEPGSGNLTGSGAAASLAGAVP